MELTWVHRAMRAGCAALLLGVAAGASAHDLRGALKKKPTTATDTFQVSCPGGDATTQLDARVSDAKPKFPSRLQLRIEKGGAASTVVDPIDGDGKYSPFASVQGGTDGVYTLSVSKLPKRDGASDKTRLYAEVYLLEFHCMTGMEHTDTDIRYAPGGNQ